MSEDIFDDGVFLITRYYAGNIRGIRYQFNLIPEYYTADRETIIEVLKQILQAMEKEKK